LYSIEHTTKNFASVGSQDILHFNALENCPPKTMGKSETELENHHHHHHHHQ
jgi:hypothetical protein